MPSLLFLWPQNVGHSLLSPGGAFSILGTVYPRGGNSPTICPVLEQGSAPEHLQYIDDIVVWGDTAEDVFEKESKKSKFLCKQVLLLIEAK